MTIVLNGTTGITNDGGYTGDGVSFADTTPSNTLVTTTGGNVGIGTASPISNGGYGGLSLNGTNGALFSLITNGTESGRIASIGNETSVQCKASTGYITFVQGVSGGTERMRIDSSGNLLVGTTSSSATANNGIKLLFPSSTSPIVNVVGSSTSSSDQSFISYSTGAGAYRFYVTMAGTIFATSTTISAISDQRLKENVRDLDFGLSEIMSLQPRKFDWKQGKGLDKKDDVGFVAQEFETIFPNSVTTSMAGEDGIEYKTINHGELIPTLVKAIQEQQAIITDLKARIETLENK